MTKLALELSAGWTRCSVDGDHTPLVRIEASRRRKHILSDGFNYRYRLIVTSNCFGNTDMDGLTDSQLADAMDEFADRFHIRTNLRRYRQFQRKLRDGSVSLDREYQRMPDTESYWLPVESESPEPVAAVEPVNNWEDSLLDWDVSDPTPIVPAPQPQVARVEVNFSTLAETANLAGEMFRTYNDQLRLYNRWTTTTGTPNRITDWSISA